MRWPSVVRLWMFVCSVVVLQGCTHWVVIRSSPPGARVKVDGVYQGVTPRFFEETTGWSKVYRLELEKEGYETRLEKLEQNDLQWRYACPAACLCPPTLGLSLTGCLFSYGLADEYNFVLVPLDDSVRPLPETPREKDESVPSVPPSPESPPADVPKKDERKPESVVPF